MTCQMAARRIAWNPGVSFDVSPPVSMIQGAEGTWGELFGAEGAPAAVPRGGRDAACSGSRSLMATGSGEAWQRPPTPTRPANCPGALQYWPPAYRLSPPGD